MMSAMNEDPYTRYWRFHTPDPDIAPREQAPMLAEEQAWAYERARGQRFDWLTVLMAPLCLGAILPFLVFLTGLWLLSATFMPTLAVDRIVGSTFGWQVLVTLTVIGAWGLRNYLRDRRDPVIRYWAAMPGQGLVELERHRLVAGTCLWVSDFDPDCNTLTQWKDGEWSSTQSSGVSQWIVATTAAGHWLVLKEEYAGNFTYNRVGCMPALDKQLHPAQNLAVAFAPRTNVMLGRRFDGEPIPLTRTTYWLSADEHKRLTELAHHWHFFPPDRYGVINPQDAAWVQRLVDKAQASAEPADC